MTPFNWVFPILLIGVALFTWGQGRLLVLWACACAFIGLAVTFFRIPIPYSVLIDFVLMFGILFPTLKTRLRKKGNNQGLPGVYWSMISVIPSAYILISTNHSRIQTIKLNRFELRISDRSHASSSMGRSKLHIGSEPAWEGYELNWVVSDHSPSDFVIDSDDTYWSSNHRLMLGDDVAKRIAIWSGHAPANGEISRSFDPHVIVKTTNSP